MSASLLARIGAPAAQAGRAVGARRSGAPVVPCGRLARSVQTQAAAQDEIIDLERVTLNGASSAVNTPVDVRDWSAEELFAAAQATHLASLAAADVEAEFLAGAGDADTSGYLAALQAEADGLVISGTGAAAAAAAAPLASAAAAMLESGDVPEAALIEELGAASLDAQRRDVLAGLSNDEAVAARKVVRALKLDREELQQQVLPEDWDDTTVDWFTDREAEGLPLPEFRLNFLWMEKNIAVGVDQVYARGNSAPLTEFFVWPRKDAWEELKVALEGRAWISDVDKIRLLNRLTEVINFWMGPTVEANPDGSPATPRTIEEARAAFPDCSFAGTL